MLSANILGGYPADKVNATYWKKIQFPSDKIFQVQSQLIFPFHPTATAILSAMETERHLNRQFYARKEAI